MTEEVGGPKAPEPAEAPASEPERSKRRSTFSMLFLVEVVACAAVGFTASRAVLADGAEGLLTDPTVEGIADNLVYPFLTAFGGLQGLAVLVERVRGRGLPWGWGRWTSAYLAVCVPVELVLQLKYQVSSPEDLWNLAGEDWWYFRDSLLTGVADYETPPLIAAYVALWLGREKSERRRGVLDAREWAGRVFGIVLVVCFFVVAPLAVFGF